MRDDYENADIQFNLYVASEKATTIMNYYDDLNTAFDGKPLTCTGYDTVHCNRTLSHLSRFDDVIPGKAVWQYAVEYEVYLHKQ